MKNKNHYYPLVVICVMLLGCGTFGTSGTYSLFYEPMMEVFNASKSAVTLHTSINYFTFGFANPIVAKLLKKYKIKYLMIIGVFGVAVSSMLEAVANSLAIINILNVIKGITFAGCSVIIMQTIIGNWFYKNRGLVIGLVYAVSGLSSAVISPILASVISNHGYKIGLISVFTFMIIVSLPCIFLCPFHPNDVNMKAYGIEDETIEKQADLESYNIEFNFLSSLVFIYVLNSLSMALLTNLSSHINGYASSLGFDPISAASILSAYSIGSVISNIYAGYIVDKLGSLNGTIITTIISLIGVAIMIVSTNKYLLIVGACLFGAAGAVGSVGTNSILRSVYGNKNYQMVSANMTMITSPITSLSLTAISYLYDIYGSYQMALIIGLLGGIISIFLNQLMIKRAQKKATIQ